MVACRMDTLDAVAEEEFLLRADLSRFVLHPLQFPSIYERYKQSKACFWVPGEVDLSHDLTDWNEKLTDSERLFVSNVLAFFAASDGIVNMNLAERFGREVQVLEAKYFYHMQMVMEDIHSEMYSTLITTYITDMAERTRLLEGIDTIPAVKRKAEWALKWIDSSRSFATRLVAFAVVEGIFFSGSFCAIFWLKKRGLMPGLCHSNELISRDEGMHQEFATYLYTLLKSQMEESEVHAIVQEAVEEEVFFCTEALPVDLIGMNSRDMTQYIRFVADRLLTQLGVPKLYHATNPFAFMELISLEGKTNFFERRVGEYQKAGAGCSADKGVFNTEADF